VQGVGFRPFVCRLARDLELGGLVGNDAQGAFIEVEGAATSVVTFETRLAAELPPLATISEIRGEPRSLLHEHAFRIVESTTTGAQQAEIAPDVATCDDCVRELFDSSDRRYRYPFINCTNCGPRYSIIQGVPYDRPNTTMARFAMCPECQAEYDDPTNRRFHAQPNACPVCGPRICLMDFAGQEVSGNAIRICAEWLRCGAIIAIKGIGGFHLACCADNDMVVSRLRRRKLREAKPLAMMIGTLDAARELAEVDEAAASELAGTVRPIVLVPRRPDVNISHHVAPDGDYFGLMLPYTPLHHLLFAEGLCPLVMTSANPSEEPLCRDNDEARERLARAADAFLLNNRDIERRVDDSVVLSLGSTGGGRAIPPVVPLRRARGLAPEPIPLEVEAPEPVLAVGGELKSAVCLVKGREAVLSEHLGELSNPVAYRNFVETIEQFKRLLDVEPKVVAHDLHPEYASTRYARGLNVTRTEVQHHHAHVISVMADAGLSGPVVGISCDGTGYGPDGAIWGCEILCGDEAGYERAAHLAYYPLLGGDAAAREGWRPAVALLREAYGETWREEAEYALKRVEAEALQLAGQRLEAGSRAWVPTSSLGRLFDAAAFLLGVCDENRHEAQSAMSLEAVARSMGPGPLLEYEVEDPDDKEGPALLDVRPLIRELVSGMRTGRDEADLARAFHETIAVMLADAAHAAAERRGLNRVVLSGGCMVNQLLLGALVRRLEEAGLDVHVQRRVPPGDGGIALGQALAAVERVRRGEICA
jgi:hydrogenase maturation protein HypF